MLNDRLHNVIVLLKLFKVYLIVTPREREMAFWIFSVRLKIIQCSGKM